MFSTNLRFLRNRTLYECDDDSFEHLPIQDPPRDGTFYNPIPTPPAPPPRKTPSFQYKDIQRQVRAERRKEAFRNRLTPRNLNKSLSASLNGLRRRFHHEEEPRTLATVMKVYRSGNDELFDSLIPLEVAMKRNDIVRRPELFELELEKPGFF